MNFAEKLKEMRQDKGLSQVELAGQAGISARTLQNYEMGKRYPASIDIAVRLAKTLGTTAQMLLSAGEEAIVKAQPASAKKQLEALVCGVTGLFTGGDLPEEDRDAALEAIITAYWEAKRESRKYAPRGKSERSNGI